MEIKFVNPAEQGIQQWAEKCFETLLATIGSKLDAAPQDRIGISFNNNDNDKGSFNISFRRYDQYSPEAILSALDKVLQSNVKFLQDDRMVVNVDHISIPVGGSRRTAIGKTYQAFSKIHSRTLYTPKINVLDGEICLPVAILVGISFADGVQAQNRFNFLTYEPNHAELIAQAEELATTVGVDYQNGCGVDEIRKFSEYYAKEYNITVYNSRSGRSVLFKSPYTNKRTINLLLENNHYSVIKSLTGVFGCAYFCTYCAVPYTTNVQHKKCPFKCNNCFSSPPCKPDDKLIKCGDCNRNFSNTQCFQKHIASKICLKVRICTECLQPYSNTRKGAQHVCGQKYCFYCKKDRPSRHECFIPIIPPKATKKNTQLFIFFDLECTQTKPFTDNSERFEHVPNLCVAHQACETCMMDNNIDEECVNCGAREHVFHGGDIIEKFMTYLGEFPEKFKNIKILAHNLQKYDGHFILRYLYMNQVKWNFEQESILMNGSRLLQIKIGRYRFLDSLNFFAAPLSKLPKMFNLSCASKGYYPHYFNTDENVDYVGPIPAIEYYGVDSMKDSDRTDFLSWYMLETQSNRVFNNKETLIGYCRQDVNILRHASLKFRELLIDLSGVDPFEQITIAGTCMAVLKTNFLMEDQIAIIPSNGYRLRDNQSFKAIKWLEYRSHIENRDIISAVNSREVRLTKDIIVDGFYEDTVYEFLGCYWHQCPICFPLQYHNAPNSKSTHIRTRYDSFVLRSEKIQKMGFKFIYIWEHEFDQMIKDNSEVERYLNTLDHIRIEPLNPRDAFFGGRTGVCKLYHEVSRGEKILYYDVTSLYPFINKYSKYPIGVPRVLIGKSLEGRSVFDINGIIKCVVLPPKRLYHPVLPLKMHNKLLFVLCHKCASDISFESCRHSNDERSFTGTYVAEELRVAVRKGYKILKLYEAWEYEMTQYDPITKQGGIFAEYINTFLKIKTESSGYPSWVKTDNDKKLFIESFYEREGVRLDTEAIKKNPGLRSLSKICLNSIWGKFGERPDKVKKMFIDERDQLLDIVTNPSYETSSLYMLTSETALLSYSMVDEANMKRPNVNVAIAAYTTAHARLHLYKYLDTLGERILYYDTDSVFFTQKDNEITLPLGDYLGDLTNELSEYGENSFIDEVVFTSEKSYSFSVNDGSPLRKYVCKVKGISLNHENSHIINFNSMKSMVLSLSSHDVRVLSLKNNVILRESDSTVYSTKKAYSFKVNATKRRKIGVSMLRTLPYGYVD